MTTRIEIEHVRKWLESQTPNWAKDYAIHHHVGAMEAIIMCICNGSTTPAELAERIRQAQPKQEVTV